MIYGYYIIQYKLLSVYKHFIKDLEYNHNMALKPVMTRKNVVSLGKIEKSLKSLLSRNKQGVEKER
jgi:hypothetical protein